MKKGLFVICIFFMTGCFGEVGRGIITKECNKQELVNGMSIDTNITIKSKEGNLSTIKIMESYNYSNLEAIINSKKSEANMYINEDSISIDIDNNIVTYNIDVLSASDFVKERFNIKNETHKMIKFYEDNGYTCK